MLRFIDKAAAWWLEMRVRREAKQASQSPAEQNRRLRDALQHIADGNISAAIRFSRMVVAGESIDVAMEALDGMEEN